MIWLLGLLALAAVAGFLPFYTERHRAEMGEADRRAAPGRIVQLSAGATHVQWHGPTRGPVAVCIHGLTTPSFVFDALAEGLGALGYRVVTYDLYGRGFSDRPDGAQDAEFFVTQLEELLEAEEIGGDITLVGYSMGGAIATAFAARHPGMVRQLVLIAAAGTGALTHGVPGLAAMTGRFGDWLMLALFPAHHRRTAEREAQGRSSVSDITARQARELAYRGYIPAVLASLRGILSETRQEEHGQVHREGIPVLAIWGRKDKVVPITAMGRLAQWSRNAHQEVIEGAGHGLVFTHTAEVLDVLRERLREGLS